MKIQYFIGIVLLLGCFPARVLSQPAASAPLHKALLDLRNNDLGMRPVELNGEWSFAWKKLVDSSAGPAAFNAYASYPDFWTRSKDRIGVAPQGYASYGLTILLPSHHQQLAFDIPALYCAYRFYVNGKLIAQNGRPDSSIQHAEPYWCARVAVLEQNTDTLHCVLQVANFWHAKGGTVKPISIGDKNQLLLNYHQNTALDLVLAGCLFMGGLFFFGLSLFARNDRITFFFSLFCIVTSYRMVGTDLYVLHSLFPNLSWYVAIRLEYISLVGGVALFSAYTQLLYLKDNAAWPMRIVLGLCSFYGALILFAPPIVFTGLLNYFLIVMFLYIVYAFYIYVQAVLDRRRGAGYALASSGVMLFVYFIVNLQYFNFIPEVKLLVSAGYVTFFFLQSLVMSRRFAEILQQAADEARQGLRVKSEFLSTMSHEIRTPLNSVIGMAHLLNRTEPRPDQKEKVEVLLFSANNLLSIVNNILDYNKIEAGKISIEQIEMDLPAICRNVIAGLQNMADDKRVALHLKMDPLLVKKVIGDPTRTSQVLNNLVHNALKFTKEGKVELAVSVEYISRQQVRLRISVSDTGIGIAPEKQQLIFERFTQADSSTSRSFGGTGLGLSISKKILEMQGCILGLNSEPGKGSEFFFVQEFVLGENRIENDKPADQIVAETPALTGVPILLVEDNPFNVMVAKAFLERCGALIDTAENGEEALRAFDPARHRLVLMDLDMPVMDGFEATRRLRARGETVPVIALTASLPKEVESEVFAAGLNDIIVKPFNPDDLFRVILQHLKAMAA